MFFLVSDTDGWEEKVPFVIPLFLRSEKPWTLSITNICKNLRNLCIKPDHFVVILVH